MELDDLKLAWQSLDRRLAEQHALNLHVFKETKLAQAKSKLRPLMIGQVLQLLAGVAICLLFAPFWIEHIGTPHFLISGVLLHAYGIMFIALAVRELILIGQIDYAAPVLVIQKQLAELRRWRIRIAPLFGVTGCFIWIPLMLVIFNWLGADLWVKAPQVVYWCFANGFVGLGILLAIRKWSQHQRHVNFGKAEDDSIVGRSLQRAECVLAEIASFERE